MSYSSSQKSPHPVISSQVLKGAEDSTSPILVGSNHVLLNGKDLSNKSQNGGVSLEIDNETTLPPTTRSSVTQWFQAALPTLSPTSHPSPANIPTPQLKPNVFTVPTQNLHRPTTGQHMILPSSETLSLAFNQWNSNSTESGFFVDHNASLQSSSINPTGIPTYFSNQPSRPISSPNSPGNSTNATLLSNVTIIQPVDTGCIVENGVYGDLQGQPYILTFGYEIERLVANDQGSLNSLLPLIEHEFSNYLVPAVFPNQCNSTQRLLKRRLDIQGISSLPDDTVMDNAMCSQKVVKGSTCTLMQGEMSLYTSTGELIPAEEMRIKTALKEGMENGAFIDVDPSILRLSYVDLTSNGTNPSINKTENNPQTSSSGNNLMIAMVVTGAGSFVIVFAAVLCRRTKKRDDTSNTKTSTIIHEATEAGGDETSVRGDATVETSTTVSAYDSSTVDSNKPMIRPITSPSMLGEQQEISEEEEVII
jgi:hypothetical protein